MKCVLVSKTVRALHSLAILQSTTITLRKGQLDDSTPCKRSAAMAEWLRRLTRNQMGSSRVGSNPTRSGLFANH